MAYDLELEGLGGGIGDLFGLGALKEVAIDSAFVGVSAGVAQFAGKMAFEKIGLLANLHPIAKWATAIAAGIGGAAAIDYFTREKDASHWSKKVAGGWAAGLVGWAVQDALNAGARKMGLGHLSESANDLLAGLGDIEASDYRPIPGQTDGLNGMLAQAISVDEMQQVPGGGYLSGDDLSDQERQVATYIS